MDYFLPKSTLLDSYNNKKSDVFELIDQGLYHYVSVPIISVGSVVKLVATIAEKDLLKKLDGCMFTKLKFIYYLK